MSDIEFIEEKLIEGFIEGRKLAKRNLGDVLILGLGVSGKACAKYLVAFLGERVSRLVIAGGSSSQGAIDWVRESGIENMGASVVFDTEQIDGHFDLCIASPGISEFSDFYQNAKAASDEIISEVEFAWRESSKDSKWIAVTGTNGKTTTTSLIDSIIENAGLNAHAVGNIGDTCIEAVGRDNACALEDDLGDALEDALEGALEGTSEDALGQSRVQSTHSVPIYVVETSSYQLASIVDFAPDVAVILGITPDHLTWHKSHENYVQAKFKLLSNLSAKNSGVAILDATNDEVRAKVRKLKNMSDNAVAYIPIGTAKGIGCDMRQACGSLNAAFVDESSALHIAFNGVDHSLVNVSDLQLEGRHNHLNALAASAACVVIGIDDEKIDSGLKQFSPLEHRIEPSGSHNGVDFYNDSKATNVDATLVAVKAFLLRKPIVLLGGRDKLSPLDDLVHACEDCAKCVICYGEAKDRFIQAFEQLRDKTDLKIMSATGLTDAFQAAVNEAKPGDVVLLSPACASFDEFTCFEERGEYFKKLVNDLGL